LLVTGDGVGVDVFGIIGGCCDGVLFAGGLVGLLVAPAGVLVAVLLSVAGGGVCVSLESGSVGSADISGSVVAVSLVSGKDVFSDIPLDASGGVVAVCPQAVSETIMQNNIMIVNISFCISSPLSLYIYFTAIQALSQVCRCRTVLVL